MKSKTVRVSGVGKVLLQRSSRARHLCLSVRPFKGVRVAVPYGVPFSRAQKFVRSKTPWIRKYQAKINRIETQAVTLSRQEPLERSRAESQLKKRLKELARKHGFVYAKVFVRNQKTRWGSCSAADHISLNINLVRLPADIMDYAILHELMHTRVKNHGPLFWEQLDSLVGNARRLDRALSGYNVLLLAAHIKRNS